MVFFSSIGLYRTLLASYDYHFTSERHASVLRCTYILVQYTTFVWDPLSLSDCRLLRECPSVNIGIPLFTKMPAGYYCRSSSSHVLSGTMNAGVERNRQLHCTCPLPVCPQRINMSGDMLGNFLEWQFIST